MCGTLAPHTMAPAGGGQLLCCVWCHTQVPVNAHVCSRGHDPGQQKIRRSLQAHIMCVCCGRGNPADLSHCLTCDTRLHATALEVESAPCVQEDSHKANLSCSACGRVNRGDARFCDWCGTKKTVGCVFRGASVAPRAASCAVCGRSPEAAPGSRADATVSTSRAGPPTAERHAQTSGTHWPSGTGRPRAPRAAVSPGRGYWRKQLDHVCAHLRSFAHNDAPFRTLLGEPRLGRMTSAVLQENGREVILTLGFAAAAAAEDVRHKVGEKVAGEAARETAAAPKTPPGSGSKASGAEMSKDVQLLQELGPGPGSSRVGVVQRLLDQGADPNCQGGGDYDARPAAAIATINGHHAVLPLLLQRGADMDRQSGLKKNTALHEAAARGPEGLCCAQVLLSCNAATGVRNVDGLTAYDVAVTGGNADMMSLLDGSASLGGAELTPGSTLRNSSRVVV